jgi:hypothetical protein
LAALFTNKRSIHMKKSWLGVIAAWALVAPALSANLSHLECFKIKDNIPAATYTADQLLGEPGCVIRVPAKIFCAKTSKLNVTPPPPGGGPDVDLNVAGFFCYKEKCPRTNFSISAKDQFGRHNIPFTTGFRSKMLCAPASPSGAFLD